MNIKVELSENVVPEPLAERRVRSESAPPTQPVQNDEDQVELSREAQTLSSLKEMASGVPDIRTEKVDSIMKQIQEGSYSIDSRLIAERMIQDHTSS